MIIKPTAAQGGTKLWVESLEERQMMSVAMDAPVLGKHGHLTISGTAHNDQIDISRSGSMLRISVDGHVSKFAESRVSDITVLPSSGSDHVATSNDVHQTVATQKPSVADFWRRRHRNDSPTPTPKPTPKPTPAPTPTPTPTPIPPPSGATPATFPIGVWLQPTYTFDDWKARGINTMVGYESLGGTVSMATWMSAATSHGFMQIRPPSGDFAADARDPNLLAFLQQDEPDGKGTSPATLAANYKAWKSAAPNVPVFLNLDGSRVLGWQGNVTSDQYRAFTATADFIGSDVYPVTGWGRPNSLGAPGDSVTALSALSGGKSQFAFIEASNQQLSWVPNDAGPTTDQFRGEIWDSIIKGARGIFYFPQQIGNGFKYDNTTPAIQAEMTRQDARITSIGAALETAINPTGITATVGAGFTATTRVYNGKEYYIVMNQTTSTVTKTVTLGGVGTATIATVDSESRSVSINQGKLVDTFAPYDVHVYVVG